MTDLRRAIAKKIKNLREARGWNQTELAKEAKTSQVTISSIETGASATNIDLLADIARALNTTPAALLAEPEARETQPPSALREVLERLLEMDEPALRGILKMLPARQAKEKKKSQ